VGRTPFSKSQQNSCDFERRITERSTKHLKLGFDSFLPASGGSKALLDMSRD
jgi:hypothetical protein